jgi:hypothetical protein
MVKEHLDTLVVDKQYPYKSSQKEEIVDKEYLSQWMHDNKRTQ